MIDDAMKERLRAKVEETYAKLELHFGRAFPRCKGNFDVDSTHTASKANYRENTIKINLAYLKAHTEYVVEVTVPHEICHLVAGIVYPNMRQHHGPEWKHCMKVVGLQPETYHQLGRVHKIDMNEFI